MKKYVRCMLAVLTCLTVCFLCMMTARAESAREWKRQWYDTEYYPIYQELYAGKPEFAKRVEGISYTDMIDILNPPEDMLLDMSTQELANLMQEYPLMHQVMTYFGPDGELDYSMLYEFLEINSDIFYELLRREDGIIAILNTYRMHEPDSEKLREGISSVETERMFLAELFGCHFIQYYAHLFTDEEYELACLIIGEKEKVYAEYKDIILSDYWELPEIKQIAREAISGVRTNYLSVEEIQEKEERLKDKEIKPSSDKRRYQKAMVGAGAALGVLCVAGGGVVFARRKKEPKTELKTEVKK